MKRGILLAITLLLLTQTTIYSAAVENISEQRGYISANVEKTKEVYPNIAEITFTKETKGKTIEEASKENKVAITEINKALQAYKSSNESITEIRTGTYTARPNYIYKNNKRQIIDYTVINSITIRTKATELLGKMIDSAIKAGAERVGALSFSYESDGTICKELIQNAVKEAYTIAEATAATTKQSLKGVKYINTGCYTQMSNMSNYRNFATSKAIVEEDTGATEAETTITPGKIKVRANVNTEFYVK